MIKTINNVVTFTFEYGNEGDIRTDQTECSAKVTINQGLIRITKSSTPIIIGKDEHITYTIVVSAYETPRDNVIVEDTLPDGVTLDNNIAYMRNNADEAMTEMTTANRKLIINNQNLSFVIGSMAADTMRTITFTASLGTDIVNPILNRATVTYNDDDSASSNYTSNTYDYTDLEIVKSAPDLINCNSNLSYTITITNTGTQDATDVTLTDILEFDNANFEILMPIAENIYVDGTMIANLTGILAELSTDKKLLTITGLNIPSKNTITILINGIVRC